MGRNNLFSTTALLSSQAGKAALERSLDSHTPLNVASANAAVVAPAAVPAGSFGSLQNVPGIQGAAAFFNDYFSRGVVGTAPDVSSGFAVTSTVLPDGTVNLSYGGPSMALAAQAMKSGSLQVLDSHLAALYYQNSSLADVMSPFIASVGQLPGAVRSDAGGHRFVAIDVNAKDGDGAALLHQLQALGLKEGGSFGAAAGGLLPVEKIAALLHLDNLGHASEAASMTSAGSVDTQADQTMLAQAARLANFGVDGHGITVGVMSDSFNHTGEGDTTGDQESGDLPSGSNLVILDDSNNGEDEGRGMAQLVHDLAPGAKIVFADDGNSQATMAANITALMNAGCKVIVDDITYFAEPSYQDGVISQAIQQFVDAGGIYLTSAANEGRNGFEETSFIDSGVTVNGEIAAKLTNGAAPAFLNVTIPHGRTVYFILQWDQPAGSASPGHAAAKDMNIYVLNQNGTSFINSDTSNQIGGDPVAITGVANNSGSDSVIKLAVTLGPGTNAPNIHDFKIIALLSGGGQLKIGASPLNTNDGSIFGHAASSAFSVGAVPYYLTPYSEALGPVFSDTLPTLEDFSSAGPTTILFDKDGHRLATPLILSGPAFSAVDGGDTTFFGFDDGIDGDGLPNFYGTSAAAPDAAAVVALMLQANSALTRADVLAILQDSAWDITQRVSPTQDSLIPVDAGFDSDSGSGLINAALAVQAAQTLYFQPTALQTIFRGTHLNDTFAFDNIAVLAVGEDGSTISGDRKLLKTDTINGGTGVDTVVLNGDYGGAGLVFGPKTMLNVERMSLGGGHSYKLTTNDATVAADKSLKVDGSGLGATDVLTFIGSAETNGSFVVNGGAGKDKITGGAGDDIIIGGKGGDLLAGGGGGDIFTYANAGDSSSTNYDTITGLNFTVDRLNLPGTIKAVDTAITTGHLATGTFDADLTAALGGGHLAAHHAVLFTASSGGLAGETFLVVDLNGTAGYTANADLVIHLNGTTGTLAFGDFV